MTQPVHAKNVALDAAVLALEPRFRGFTQRQSVALAIFQAMPEAARPPRVKDVGHRVDSLRRRGLIPPKACRSPSALRSKPRPEGAAAAPRPERAYRRVLPSPGAMARILCGRPASGQ